MVDVDSGDRSRRAVVRCRCDDILFSRHLGRDLHGDIWFAFIVENDHFVFVFRLGIAIAQSDSEVG